MSGLGVGSALEHRCRLVDDSIVHALESAAESGDFSGVLRAMEVGCSVLEAQLFLRVETPCSSSEENSPSDESDPGFLPVCTGPVSTGPSRPVIPSASSAFDVVYPGAGPDDVDESDSEGGYVSGSTDSTVWVPNL